MRNSSCVSSTALETAEFDGVMTPPYGMTLGQVKDLLSCYLPAGKGWEVKALTAEVGLAQFGKELGDCFDGGDECRGMMNFLRSSLGQPGGGHWSPIVGTSFEGGRWMVLDVAKYKEQYSYFLNTEGLYNAVDNVDACGIWGWREGKQKDLSEEERKPPEGFNSTDPSVNSTKADILEKLGCEEAMRGIILMRRKT